MLHALPNIVGLGVWRHSAGIALSPRDFPVIAAVLRRFLLVDLLDFLSSLQFLIHTSFKLPIHHVDFPALEKRHWPSGIQVSGLPVRSRRRQWLSFASATAPSPLSRWTPGCPACCQDISASMPCPVCLVASFVGAGKANAALRFAYGPWRADGSFCGILDAAAVCGSQPYGESQLDEREGELV